MPASGETRVDERAVVSSGAELDHGVEVGPFSVIGEGVRIGAGTIVGPHVVLEGRTTIGKENRIFQFASIGTIPQDLKYAGEDSEVVIGDRNQVRECVTIHKGTEGGGMVTAIGDDNLIMAYSHVAHDCRISNRVILANAATLAGHVTMEDHSFAAGMAGVHQFCRIGKHAFLSAGTVVVKDVAPFTMVQGDRATLSGLNLVGLKRSGLSDEQITSLKKAYRILFRSGLVLEAALEKVKDDLSGDPQVEYLAEFVRASERGVTR